MTTMKFSHRVIFVGASLFISVTLYLFLNVQTLQDNRYVPGRKLMETHLWPLRDFNSPVIQPVSDCAFGTSYHVSANITTQSIFNSINFRTSYDGSYPLPTVETPPRSTRKDKIAAPLRVVVVPHSHNDPGWIKTLDEYYIDQTQHILNNMVERLTKYPNMTFVWSETVFLSIWWNNLEDHVRLQVRRLVRKGQLEIVLGGWVVPDEASTHYFSLIEQIIEGHQWILENLNVKPVNSWSIDSFGHSSTVSYLWKQTGLQNMVIQRVHGSVKGYLADKKSLEFRWRQFWDQSGSTDIMCHVMPYALYTIKYTCGPDRFMCLMFDFRHIPGEVNEAKGKTIDDTNIESQATYLYEQYRKKSSLYKYGTVLVPLGDDFRFNKPQEWQQQHDNYMKLFEYMNSRKDWNIDVGFGTLKDYFDALRVAEGRASKTKSGGFPVLSGDFFPYSDRDNTYWSGYYSSRPFGKRLSREVENTLRSAEILTTFANIYSKQLGYRFDNNHVYLASLQQARRSLALFQHHDAITGTSKEYVAGDYMRKLAVAYNRTQEAVAGAMQMLLTKGAASVSENKLLPAETKTMFLRFPQRKHIHVSEQGTDVVFFNPVGQKRKELVHLQVDSDTVEVRDETDSPVPCQLNPVWVAAIRISEVKFEIVFPVELAPLGLAVYKLTRLSEEPAKLYPAGILMYNTLDFVLPSTSRLIEYRPDIGSEIVLQNEHLKATFSQKTGYLQSIVNKTSGLRTETKLEFRQYKSRGSGAYIFYPEEKAHTFEELPFIIRVIKGPIMSSVEVVHQQYLRHLVKLYSGFTVQSLGLHIENEIFLFKMADVEVIMHVKTDLGKRSNFFTDQNGYQFIARKTHAKLPIQGNYYPMTSACFLEDPSRRVTLHSGQALGVASLKNGEMEVMLDRMLIYDDDRGLGEGLQDNKPTRLYFVLQVEYSETERTPSSLKYYSYPSLISSAMNDLLQNPVQTFYATPNMQFAMRRLNLLKEPFPCDITLVNLRNLMTSLMTENGTGVILHRRGFDCSFRASGLTCGLSHGELDLDSILSEIHLKQARKMSLSYMYELKKIKTGRLQLSPMEIASFHVQW